MDKVKKGVIILVYAFVGWAAWHLPLFLYRPGYMGMGIGIGEIFGWILSLLTGSILLTWLYNSTRLAAPCGMFSLPFPLTTPKQWNMLPGR